LLAAFDRFFEDAVKSDPQCWAKNAISRALAEFEHPDAQVFLRGMRHTQLEPVWGGTSDTAATLRSTCALALVQCRAMPDAELLAHLIELLADKVPSVRAEAAHAIANVGSQPAALLLRLRAALPNNNADGEPEVLGACYSGVLSIEGIQAIPWVARFLANADGAAAEAALALAATHTADGFEVLRQQIGEAADPWFRSVLLSAIALTRQEAATEFLLDEVRRESLNAEAATEAILRAAPSSEVIERLENLVQGNPRLTKVFLTHRNSDRP